MDRQLRQDMCCPGGNIYTQSCAYAQLTTEELIVLFNIYNTQYNSLTALKEQS